MQKKVFQALSFLFLGLYATPLYCNMIWPALFVGAKIFSSLYLVILSIGIEALFFLKYLKNISFGRALLISLVGNAASALVGTVVMGLAMIIWHFAFDTLLGGTFNIYNLIATFTLMYIGSCLIEFLVIKLFFRYPSKDLWIPILVGNFVTYALVAIAK